MLLSKYFQYFFGGLDSRQKAMASELRNVISFSHVISLTLTLNVKIPVFINIFIIYQYHISIMISYHDHVASAILARKG